MQIQECVNMFFKVTLQLSDAWPWMETQVHLFGCIAQLYTFCTWTANCIGYGEIHV